MPKKTDNNIPNVAEDETALGNKHTAIDVVLHKLKFGSENERTRLSNVPGGEDLRFGVS
jgi:hypothetical protein